MLSHPKPFSSVACYSHPSMTYNQSTYMIQHTCQSTNVPKLFVFTRLNVGGTTVITMISSCPSWAPLSRQDPALVSLAIWTVAATPPLSVCTVICYLNVGSSCWAQCGLSAEPRKVSSRVKGDSWSATVNGLRYIGSSIYYSALCLETTPL